MPPKEEYVYNVKAIMDDGTEVALTELDNITLTEMEEVLEVYDCVRVVRCRDCQRAYFYEHKEGEHGILCTEYDADVTEDDFCSYGERRQDGEQKTGEELARG